MWTAPTARPGTRLAALVVALLVPLAAVLVPAQQAAADPVPGDAHPASVKKKGCTNSGKRFRPTSLGVPGVSKRRAVLALGRDANNVPKAPPLTDTGKRQFAWDAKDKIRAGARHGVVKTNAHTYPDGSAIGNDLINGLQVGGRIVARGAKGQVRCYEVIDRVQITAEKRFKRYYRTDGPGRLAIAVCSGVRRGAGDWSHRTIWFAKVIR
ncbi:class F sortase [Nocardioides sp.]|uniref:class F sortase n=1 Tax=Nocardioides sp. TaxID=35761 RepID=UPI001D66D9ED|nr:class F sortase [Nocardioides sp.]MBU1802756.1 class F sortase [Actinomycetota bacterium]